jgi:hypothetical protein
METGRWETWTGLKNGEPGARFYETNQRQGIITPSILGNDKPPPPSALGGGTL